MADDWPIGEPGLPPAPGRAPRPGRPEWVKVEFYAVRLAGPPGVSRARDDWRPFSASEAFSSYEEAEVFGLERLAEESWAAFRIEKVFAR